MASPSPDPLKAQMSGTPPEEDVIERDFPLRRVVALHLSNLRGAILVQGWSQDRIRVRAVRRVVAGTAEEIKKARDSSDIRFASVEGVYEVSADYGRGLSLSDRLKERAQPRSNMDLSIQVPQGVSLRIGTTDGAIRLAGWKGTAEMRSGSGAIDLENLEGDSVSAFCDDCTLRANSLKVNLKANTRSGAILIDGVNSKSLFLETQTGTVTAKGVHADTQLYVSRAGDMLLQNVSGNLEFSNSSGNVHIFKASGFISGHTQTGGIVVEVDRWKFAERALFETLEGSVKLRLPRDFVGEVELRSMAGTVRSDFVLDPPEDDFEYGPLSPNHLRGKIGRGKQQLQIQSRSGNIELLRGA